MIKITAKHIAQATGLKVATVRVMLSQRGIHIMESDWIRIAEFIVERSAKKLP